MEIILYRIILFGLQIEKLKNFYLDNFGFLLVEETKDEWVVLKAGQIELALHKIGQGYIDESNQDFKVGSNSKLIFMIDADIKKFRQRLKDNGVILQDIKSFKGINSLFCDGEDFEGNVFQIEQRLGKQK